MLFSSAPTCDENFIENIEFSELIEDIKSINFEQVFVTGGGSIKYKSYVERLFGVFHIVDEMEGLVKGAKIILQQFHESNLTAMSNSAILVNIGTGASFVGIETDFKYHRIGGTNIGGGTLKGIFELSGGSNFGDSIDDLISSGFNENVDCLVKDIYGSDYESIGLDGNVIAGSLAKASSNSSLADICSGAAYMICSNIINLVSIHSKILGAKTWIFSGSFVAIPSVSKILHEIVITGTAGSVFPISLNHCAYIGCIGALSEILYISNENKLF